MKQSNKKQGFSLDGKVLSESIEIDGVMHEHITFRDDENKFGEVLEKFIGKRMRVTFEVLEDKDSSDANDVNKDKID